MQELYGFELEPEVRDWLDSLGAFLLRRADKMLLRVFAAFRNVCCLCTVDVVPVDPELLTAARAAEARLIDAERAADIARADFHHSVRRLQLSGGSLRAIAAALGLSHPRVHQIVVGAGGARPWRRASSG